VESSSRSPDHRTRLFGASQHDGQADWSRSRPIGIRRKHRDARSGNRDGTAAKSEAAGTTSVEGDDDRASIELLTMPEAGADSLLVYGFIAMTAHLLMSLGQTLFHRHLGHSRLGGRFFANHIQFHHTHYSGDHVVSTQYLDNGDNNTLFFLMPVALIVSLSYLFLRLDLLMVQLAIMTLSFCGHYYIDNQYHVAGSWLGRFAWFRRKQQLHFIHHRHGNCNFAVIDFFWDRLLGTYRSVEPGRDFGTPIAATRPRPSQP
jgi:sterol desaturase/sphingolipid hydroxylase (fatty acid hydroxylase superfamily)